MNKIVSAIQDQLVNSLLNKKSPQNYRDPGKKE